MQIKQRNVNGMIIEALWTMRSSGSIHNSRNGPVLVLPEPIMLTYNTPQERVLFWPKRDCNPFFHLMEAIWMMAGRNDVAYLRQYNKQMDEYAEPDGLLWGAYGFRWQQVFGFDQVQDIVHNLSKNFNDRRQVLAMWGPATDLGNDKKDLPCNTHAYFSAYDGRLDMTVCNRSNDLIWGALGANAVHFSFLQEAMAGAIGIPVGRYVQFSNNMHVYHHRPDYADLTEILPTDADDFDEYAKQDHLVYPLDVRDIIKFESECRDFTERKYGLIKNPFLRLVAQPMQEFYLARKDGLIKPELLDMMPNCDWKIAAIQWVQRRDQDRIRKQHAELAKGRQNVGQR